MLTYFLKQVLGRNPPSCIRNISNLLKCTTTISYVGFLNGRTKWFKPSNELSVPLYFTQNGPNEFTIIGTWKGWDITARLPERERPKYQR